MTLEEIKTHLRKEYASFSCPQKSDRLIMSEDIWQQIDWTDEEKARNAALPHKLWNMRHDDNEWPGCHNWRGHDARGPRAGIGNPKYLPPLPVLVQGRGIARWMTANDESVLEIPLFKDYSVMWTTSTIPATLEVTERQCSRANYGETYTITKEELFEKYAPSPLQKFSDKSWLKVYPTHQSYHIMYKRNKGYCGEGNIDDDIFFWRYGWRWDSGDNYYTKGGAFIGGHWN